MALPAEFSLLHSEFNAFLFASLLKEESGAPLSVLSALTRLGVDPWREGARLSRLPKDAAARALVALIARFPEEHRTSSDAREIADRLVEMLPKGSVAVPPANAERAGTRRRGWVRMWLFWLGLSLLLANLIAQALQHWK
ncbi:MAG TPA: hypothetical protein VN832_09975 [Stellaceae bacterium]|nr:hypothetical protein [Stellaceae bacterium]